VLFGALISALGLLPDVIGLGITPGIGVLQIGAFLAGLTIMTLGAYLHANATRERPRPARLRYDIGARLMATGLIIAYASGFADVLAIGSHYGLERPFLGPFQEGGIALGIGVILLGLFLYTRR
jgi:hypothetical protein